MSQTWNLPLAAGSIVSDWRLALNDAGEALRTMHAGPTAPTSPTGLMFWADTTELWVKQRDLANGAWVYRWPMLASGAMVNTAHAWVWTSSTTPALVSVPALHVVRRVGLHVPDAGNGGTTITIGHDADQDAYGLSIAVDTTGVKTVSAGVELGAYAATARVVKAYLTGTAGGLRALASVEFAMVPVKP